MRKCIDEIDFLFQRFGMKSYGEDCSQLTHAISSAEHAIRDGAKEYLVIAAFLHDIGHLLADSDDMAGLTDFGHPKHSDIAACWLQKKGFPDSVIQPIKYHVCAKRYLQRKQQTLSQASTITLAQQGGTMNDHEAELFAQKPYFADALRLRNYDNLGKPNSMATVNLDYWLRRIENFYLLTRKAV